MSRSRHDQHDRDLGLGQGIHADGDASELHVTLSQSRGMTGVPQSADLVDLVRSGLNVASQNCKTMWDGERSMEAHKALDALVAALADTERERDEWHCSHDDTMKLLAKESEAVTADIRKAEARVAELELQPYETERELAARVAELEAALDKLVRHSDFANASDALFAARREASAVLTATKPKATTDAPKSVLPRSWEDA